MRSHTWMAAALMTAACGGSPSAADPLQWTVTGPSQSAPSQSPAPAGAQSCTGLMPAQVAAIPVQACSGITTTDGVKSGTTAAAARGDASGALALGCQNVQTSRDIFFVFLPFNGGYRMVAPLSEDVYPLPSGFYSTGQVQPAPAYFFDRAGRMMASLPPARGYVSAAGNVEIVSATGNALTARQVDSQGVPRGAAVQLTDAATAPAVLGGAADAAGHTLVVWASPDGVRARWLGPDGQPETAVFAISGSADQIGASAALPDGSIALGGKSPRWRSLVAQGATVESPVPQWLAARGDFSIVRGGKALLFGDELVAADGTSCGSLGLGATVAGVALDGTVAAIADERTFRVYPQLLK